MLLNTITAKHPNSFVLLKPKSRDEQNHVRADIVDILDKYREETNKVIRRNKVSVITTFLIQLYGQWYMCTPYKIEAFAGNSRSGEEACKYAG